MSPKYWLMKAEPDSRIVKGKDVKVGREVCPSTVVLSNIGDQFSVDDFESVKTTPWEGVRNHQAKNYMKDMKCGDKVRGDQEPGGVVTS